MPPLSPEEAIEILRQHHGLCVGGPRKGVDAPKLSFEEVVGTAILHNDPAVCESITPLFALKTWSIQEILAESPPQSLGRIRICAVVALIILDFSTIGIPNAPQKRVALKRLNQALKEHTLETDPWNQASKDPSIIDGYWSNTFENIGLKTNWPLADFIKRWNHTCTRYHLEN